MVSFPVGKPHHFVLEGRAVPGPYSLNLAIEQRRLVDVGQHDVVDAPGRVDLPAHRLGAREGGRS